MNAARQQHKLIAIVASPSCPVPVDDAARVAALERLEILDTPPEPAFDDLAEIAARVCDMPTGLVTLIDEKRQWFKARFGFATQETDRSIAFCGYTILNRFVFEVENAEQDPRFRANPLVTGEPHIRFYAGAPVVSSDGFALGSLAVIDYKPRKLTDRQRTTLAALANQVAAQLELRRYLSSRDQRIAALLETSLDAIVFIDHLGRILEINPAAERTFGLTRATALGKDMADLMIPPRLRDEHRHSLQGHMRGRRIETTAQRIDGRELPVEMTITRVGTEDPALFAITLRDLSELRRSIERFELAARATHDVIWDWDLRSDALWWSDTLAVNFGHDPTLLSPGLDSWLALVHPEDRVRVEESIHAEIERLSSYWSDEYRFLRSDGNYADVIDRGYITYDNEGRALRMIGAISDMTERRRLEEQLIRSQKMEAIGQFSSGIAHDFNNLLTVIHCNAFLLGDSVSRDRAVCVKDILHATERAATLTRQLLLLGRKQRLRETTVDLNQFVARMMQMLERMLTARITMTSTTDPSAPPIRADVSMIEQVLLNLVINARDAMEQGGTITISTSQITLAEPIVRHGIVAAPGTYGCLTVRDTGTGIDAATLPHIFEPFFTTKESGRGTGLGLSTVYHIAKEHHGWLDVTSETGRGTSFVIAFPAAVGAQARETPTFAVDALPQGTETLLVVEDEPLLRERIAGLLRQYGYEVIEAGSGAAALEVWREHGPRIDLVLTDLVMPGGLDGRQLALELRRDRPNLCVLYASGLSPEHAGEGEELVDGVNFLEKPYPPSKLLQVIRQRLDRRA